MKILFYINGIGIAGAERVMVTLANSLSQDYHDICLVTSYPLETEYALDSKIQRYNLEKNYKKESRIKKNILQLCRLRRVCKEQKCEVAVSFMAAPNFRLILATRFLKIKTFVSVRDDPKREYPTLLFRVMAQILYSLADGCVFQTEDAMKFFSEKIQSKGRIILNPVDRKFYSVCDSHINQKRKHVVSVGRLEEQKNYELIIKSFSEIADNFQDENLIICGEGSCRKKLISLVEQLKLLNRVIFLGEVGNIESVIHTAKIFVMASNHEGLPNALMEAMALGLPVISTDCPCGGPKLLLENGENGILVPVGNQKNMTQALKYLLENDNISLSFGEKAKIKAKEFTIEKIKKEWMEFLTNG